MISAAFSIRDASSWSRSSLDTVCTIGIKFKCAECAVITVKRQLYRGDLSTRRFLLRVSERGGIRNSSEVLDPANRQGKKVFF